MARGPPMPMPMPPPKPAAPNGEPDLPKTDPPLKMPFGLPVWMGPRFVCVSGVLIPPIVGPPIVMGLSPVWTIGPRFSVSGVIGPMGSPVVQLGFGNGS